MDLADRISRGAFAALDLVPHDPRFAQLSGQVLQGGASRFAAVVDPGESVDYVIPVGVPGASVAFGALVVQATRIGAVWRDPYDGDRHALVTLGSATQARWSPVTLGREQWARFDLDDLYTRFSFLTPPTETPELRTTLARLLGAQVAGPAEQTEPLPAVSEATPSEPVAAPAPVKVPAPVEAPAPVEVPAPVEALAEAAPAEAVPAPVPRMSPPAWQPETAVPLFRDEPRAVAPAAWQAQETVVHPVGPQQVMPAPVVASAPVPAVHTVPASYPVPASQAVPVAAAPGRSRASAVLVGFGIAFVATVVLGGSAMAVLMMLR